MALLDHGLSESGAKVYLALLDQPHMSAATLSKVTGVPRSHLYKVLEDLHAEGLTDIIVDGTMRTYRARPFADFLELRSRQMRERLAELEAQTATLGPVMVPPPLERTVSETSDVRVLIGRRVVAREIDDLLESATQEIIIGVSDHSADRVRRHLAPCWDMWQSRRSRPEVTLVLPTGATTSDPQAPFGEHVCVRQFDGPRPTLSVLVDRTRMLVIRPIPDTGDMRVGRDFALSCRDAAFIASKRGLLLASSRETASRVGSFPTS